ncbi:Predicted arabinose efflux permease, MFS family [Halogranum amylolyticum]|uniref:Predicted arabinose efflux permease, MFS family n=1 Tax=Halogranum amylolyticum TaxID=660520 RepID=A0A1H8RRJ6_9EURY|nr:MFS transporter [Halogranum amylolyticum]SEO68975.1 Predicted arabinose efflux permease, MFS family [Halogranum amylolyticum]
MTERWLYAWGLGSVAFGGASLLVPLYIVQLGATSVQLGVLASTAAVIGAPGAILFGRLANRVTRRRPLVLVTLLGVAAMLVVIPLSTNITTIIVANAALWLVVASVSPVLTMLVVDDAPESRWSARIGLLNKYQGYGWAGGLVLGTVWPLVGPRVVDETAVTETLFWLLAACAAVAVVTAAGSLPRPAPDGHVTGERRARRIARLLSSSRSGVKGTTFVFAPNRLYWSTRGIRPRRLLERLDPALATYFAAATLFSVGFAAFWAPLPLFLTESNFVSGQVFALYLVSSLASAVLYEFAGGFATKYDVRLLQSGALAVRGALFPMVVLVTAVAAVSVGFVTVGVVLAAIGATWAFIAVVGTAIVTRLAPPSVRGEVLGVHTALSAVAGGVGGVLGGWVAGFGYLTAFGVAGGLVVLASVLVFSLRTLSGGERAAKTPNENVAETASTVAVPAVSTEEVGEEIEVQTR